MAYAGKISGGGVQGYGRPRGVRWPSPRTQENFRKFAKKFLKNIAKMLNFSILFKKFNKPWVNFSHVWTKNTNCWEILRNFRKFSKYFFVILTYSSKNLTIHPLFFRAFGRNLQIVGKFWENFWWNSIEKLNVYLFLWKVVARNRAFGNNTIFYNNFFQFRGGVWTPYPLRTPLLLPEINVILKRYTVQKVSWRQHIELKYTMQTIS